MASGTWHYREAERLVSEARQLTGKRIEPDWLTPAEVIAEAQVHALLALAAATADPFADQPQWAEALR